MTADPLTRRVMDEMEQERKAREEAEVEERKMIERLVAMSPDERVEMALRKAEHRITDWIIVPGVVIGLLALMGAMYNPQYSFPTILFPVAIALFFVAASGSLVARRIICGRPAKRTGP